MTGCQPTLKPLHICLLPGIEGIKHIARLEPFTRRGACLLKPPRQGISEEWDMITGLLNRRRYGGQDQAHPWLWLWLNNWFPPGHFSKTKMIVLALISQSWVGGRSLTLAGLRGKEMWYLQQSFRQPMALLTASSQLLRVFMIFRRMAAGTGWGRRMRVQMRSRACPKCLTSKKLLCWLWAWFNTSCSVERASHLILTASLWDRSCCSSKSLDSSFPTPKSLSTLQECCGYWRGKSNSTGRY